MITELGAMLGALAGTTAVAALLGATNLGTALTFGILAFTATLVCIVMKRP